jgi:hypothetical protein
LLGAFSTLLLLVQISPILSTFWVNFFGSHLDSL